jgi:hypothetical protein
MNGCCVDRKYGGSKPCEPATCMALPDGAVGSDCAHHSGDSCRGIFPCEPDATDCGFFPCRFVVREAQPIRTATTSSKPKPVVRLLGADGNAFNVLGLCRRAARRAGWAKEQIDAFTEEATGGDYDALLATVFRHFDVE